MSEGARDELVHALCAASGSALLDLHSDAFHNRSVLTLGGPDVVDATRALARATVELLDLRAHTGVHPRLGVLDVVPFVPLGPSGRAEQAADLAPALAARDAFGRWAASALRLPCFFYGPERSLPEVRRRAFTSLLPGTGPTRPHPSAGAACVGARAPLVAYNLWLEADDLALARSVAAAIRSPAVRSLGLEVGGRSQVSCNLVAPWSVGPGKAFDAVQALAAVERAELVGLVPAAVLAVEPRGRWEELDLDEGRTLEARLSDLHR